VPVPEGIVLERHLHLEGRRWPLHFRRAVLAILGLVVGAALFGAVGQEAVVSKAQSARATLVVASPARVRGGVRFTTRLTVTSRRGLAHPKLLLDAGWLSGMQINSIVPQPEDERSVGGRTLFTLTRLPAGGRQSYYIGFQLDPTTLGRQRQAVSLVDGSETILTIRRTLTVLP
jgi:hypothetical protein